MSEEKKAEAIRLYEAGVKHREILDRLKIASSTLTSWIEAHKLKVKREKRKAGSGEVAGRAYHRGSRWFSGY